MPACVDVSDFHPAFCVSMQEVLVRVTSRRGRVCDFVSCVRGSRCYVSATVYDHALWRRSFVAATHEATLVCGVDFCWRETGGTTYL